jgi:glycosyltransferase involved in cell wall biosynthesis
MMAEAVKPGIGAVGPLSNCDKGWLFDQTLEVAGRELVPNMTLEQVDDLVEGIESYRRPKQVIEREWVAFYATLMPRAVVDDVGPLDERFLSGCEDIDYCKRVRDKGLRIVQTYDSWIFHFGGKTRKRSEDADPGAHHAEDAANHARLAEKWASPRKPLFTLFTGPAWERWTPRNVDEGGIGGSETCAALVAREFARKGWRSVVIGDCAGLEGDYEGVSYLDHSKFREFMGSNEPDLFVSSRRADIFTERITARRTACWVHDIWLSDNPAADLHADRVGRYLVLSPWHKKFFLGHHRGVPPGKVAVTRDVVDLSRYAERPEKVRGRMIYSSSPDRGLDRLLDLMPEIRKRVPWAHLHVFYGFHNWEESARRRGDSATLARIEALRRRLETQEGVVFRGRVGQAELAREQLLAQLWAYPTWFTETFCITAAEMMAAGVCVVASDLAALSTTVGHAGALIEGDSASEDYGRRFVDACARMLTSEHAIKTHSGYGLEKAREYGLEGIVDEWMSIMEEPVPAGV